MCSLSWYEVIKKTLVAKTYFLSCDSDNHYSTYVEAHLKEEWLHSWKSPWFYKMKNSILNGNRPLKAEEKQSPAVFLSLTQNICECVRHLSIVDISWAEGLKIFEDKLDEIYLQDLNTSTYIAFKEFYSNKSDIYANINDFLVCYQFLYQKLQKFSRTPTDRLFCVKYNKLDWGKWKIIKNALF